MEFTKLNNGVQMPMQGIGTFLLSPDEAEASATYALKNGCQLIDTANAYCNEKAVGRAMKNAGIDRKNIFLETKLWPSFYEQDDAVDKTLERLQTDYIDLLLIHQPAGNYIAGKDIPVGTYNFTATSGNGNVSSTNLYSGGINSIMGTPADDYTQETYNNVSLDDDVVLSLGGDVVLHIVSENASLSTMQARVVPDDAQTIDLSSGNYTAGTDFPAGTYNVVATAGNGNVSSDNLYDGGINEIMGTDGSAYTVQSFNNVALDDGVVLTVANVSVQLVPVGE